jgi:hypothetical protein
METGSLINYEVVMERIKIVVDSLDKVEAICKEYDLNPDILEITVIDRKYNVIASSDEEDAADDIESQNLFNTVRRKIIDAVPFKDFT